MHPRQMSRAPNRAGVLADSLLLRWGRSDDVMRDVAALAGALFHAAVAGELSGRTGCAGAIRSRADRAGATWLPSPGFVGITPCTNRVPQLLALTIGIDMHAHDEGFVPIGALRDNGLMFG